MANIEQQNLKKENRKWLISYLLIQIILFAIFAGFIKLTFSDVNELLSKFKNPQGFIPLLAVIFSIVLEGFLSNPIKEFLVFWRIKDRLPGHRAFSIIGPKDARVNMEKIKALFPQGIPSEPNLQNSEWFELYIKHSNETVVSDSHKNYLLTRDLTALTTTIIPLSLIGHLIARTQWYLIGYHLLFLMALIVLISIAARNYGNRFVANVLRASI